MTETATKDRAANLAKTREAKFVELFEGRHYEIIKEIHLEGEKRFETPFGNKGRNGFALLEKGQSDQKKAIFVGETVLRKAADRFGSVDVPVRERKRRTAEQKAADDAAKAAEKAKAPA